MAVFDIISIGSATLDVFMKSAKFSLMKKDGGLLLCEQLNQKIAAEQAAVSTGGAATNTSVGFARLGLQAAAVVEIGRDFAGSIVLQDLKDEKVDARFVVKEKAEETAVSVLLISEDGGRTALVYRGASYMLTEDDIPWEELDTRWIHLSSVGNAALITKMLAFCKEKKIKLSWTPGNWEIEQIRSGALKPDWSAVEILFTNREEMALLSGQDLSSEEVWKSSWCFMGPKLTFTTDGRKGGRYCVEGECFWYPPKNVQTVQETGAGDAFVTGVVGGQLLGRTLDESVALGVEEAASVIQQMGAKKGLLTPADLSRLFS